MSRRFLMKVLCAATAVWGLVNAVPLAAQTLPLISPRFGAPPAPSELTVSVLARARPLALFLEQAGQIAQHKASARLHRFAASEAAAEAATGARLDAVAAPVAVTFEPLGSAAVVGSAAGQGAETILSVLPRALQTPGAKSIAADRAISAKSGAALARLAALSGSTFDSYYAETQRDALRHLAAIYQTYTQDGDDQALLAMTVPELRRVRAALAMLRD